MFSKKKWKNGEYKKIIEQKDLEIEYLKQKQ